MTPVAAEGTKPSNMMGVARRQATGQMFLTNQIVSLVGLDPSEAQVMDLLPTPLTSDGTGGTGPADVSKDFSTPLRAIAALLPTPSANIGSNGGSQHPDKRRAGNHQPSIQDVAEHVLLPTPRATDGPKGGPNQRGSSGDMMLPSAVMLLQTPSVADGLGGHLTRSGARSNEKLLPGQAKELATDWGPYDPAIRRWERVLGRSAPEPTELTEGWLKMIAKRKAGKDKRPVGMRGSIRPIRRLSPLLTEWMMGVPEGWITGIPISRNEQLKACGNGVVPAQAAAALRDMLAAFEEEG